MKRSGVLLIAVLLLAGSVAAQAAEFHVAVTGDDKNPGTQAAPLRTIQRAADLAQAGDVITVHEGVYRERVNPPRGGASDAKRITYQAAPGEKVVITGSEIVKNWEKAGENAWKVTIPNSFFGRFNPYADLIRGDWFSPKGRQHHTGAVYLNGDWLIEAAKLDDVLRPAGGRVASPGHYLLNVAWIRPSGSTKRTAADRFAAKSGMKTAPCSEGGQCLGFIEHGHWARYEKVDFGEQSQGVEFRAASVSGGGDIELRLDKPDGELLGTCTVEDTGDWQAWASFSAKIKPTGGVKTLCVVFKSNRRAPALWFGRAEGDSTTIWAQFPGANPNEGNVEINVRRTVFTPEETGVNYITVRGFALRNAATPWAPPTAGQIGLISAYWCKGWIIENNDIGYSRCSAVALGKYSDEWDNRAESAEGYVGTLTRALAKGWDKATVGSHVVRNNHIHHCEQTGIVGSLGCSFSTVTGNEIHDIHLQRLFGGAEMGGIKFHGAIDVVISGNHIYRCGEVAGIWLDWMAQGAQVTGNFLHDNLSRDIFSEMQHGPLLIANNLLLSNRSFLVNAKGMSIAHNLLRGPFQVIPYDGRKTPFHKAHSTEVAGLQDAAGGDHGFYNNLFTGSCNLNAFDNARLPCRAGGNVFTKGAQPSKFGRDELVKADFDPGVKLEQRADGWFLTITEDAAWRDQAKRQLVTSALLGKAKIPDLPCENADGTAVKIDTDYFGRPRNADNPFPGPFEVTDGGTRTVKVWPKP